MSDEEFEDRLSCLNALYGSGMDGANLWASVESRKDHIDEFDSPIKKGEVYYRRDRAEWGYNAFKVSRESMETLLDLIFFENESFQGFAKDISEKIKNEEMRKMQEAMSKFDVAHKSHTGPRLKPKRPRKKPSDKTRPRPEGIKRIK